MGSVRLDPRALAEDAPNRLGPWTSDHLVGLIVANVLGLVAVAVGWWVAHDQAGSAGQVAWVNLAVLGFVVAGGANGVWLARGRQSVRRAQRLTLARLAEDSGPAPARVADTNGHRSSNGGGGLLATSEMTRFHTGSCMLLAGKPATATTRSEHERAGRRPCEVCHP